MCKSSNKRESFYMFFFFSFFLVNENRGTEREKFGGTVLLAGST